MEDSAKFENGSPGIQELSLDLQLSQASLILSPRKYSGMCSRMLMEQMLQRISSCLLLKKSLNVSGVEGLVKAIEGSSLFSASLSFFSSLILILVSSPNSFRQNFTSALCSLEIFMFSLLNLTFVSFSSLLSLSEVACLVLFEIQDL